MARVARVGWLVAVALGGCPAASAPSSSGTDASTDPSSSDTGTGVSLRDPETRAVAFKAEGLTLRGTLTIPARREDERRPAVILVHGSGANDRDSFVRAAYVGFEVELRPFADLASALDAAGYVVLRYDQRTCTPATAPDRCDNGYPTKILTSVDVFVHDAHAALEYLASLDEVDASRLAVVGLSQGAGFVPRLVRDRADVRAGVMLAAPYRPVEELLDEQVRTQVEFAKALGMPVSPELIEFEEAVDQLRALRGGTFMGTTIMGAPVAYWRSWFASDAEARSAILQLDRPLFVLSGDQDVNVPPAETRAYAELFASVDPTGAKDHEARVLPCLTHAFNCQRAGALEARPSDVDAFVSPEALDLIADFLVRHTGDRPSDSPVMRR